MKYIVLLLFLVMAAAGSPAQPSPISCYFFTGNRSDGCGNGNTGQLDQPSYTTDRFGSSNSALLFDGIDDILSIPDNISNNLSNNFTIATWVYPTERKS